jgi:putative nucleotidyltransferase with HDIG domain
MNVDIPENVLERVIEVGRELSSHDDPESVRKHILESVVEITRSQTGSLFVKDIDSGDLHFDVALGPAGALLKHAIRLKPREGLAGACAFTGKSEIVHDVPSDARHAARVDMMTGFSVQTALMVPLYYGEEVIGVLQLLNKEASEVSTGRFNETDVWVAETIGGYAAMVLQASRIQAAAQDDVRELHQLFASAIDAADPSVSADHSERVEVIVRGTAARLGLPGDQIERLRVAALLHDIGKLALPVQMPEADTTIDAETLEIMKEHARLGGEMVSRLPALADEVAAAIRHHHERLDGSGYPDGLAGDAIPIGARILAVAESFEVMTSAHSYGNTRSPQEALDELAAMPTAYDASVVGALRAAFRGGDLRHLAGLSPS